MSRWAVLKFSLATAVAALALSLDADQARAWWHRWGCVHAYRAPVYQPYIGYYGGHHGVWTHGYGSSWSCCAPTYGTYYSYAMPAWTAWDTGVPWTMDCCGGTGGAYRVITPSDAYEPTPADFPGSVPSDLPEPPLPQPADAAPRSVETSDSPPALPPDPTIAPDNALPDAGAVPEAGAVPGAVPPPPEPGIAPPPAPAPEPALPLLPGATSRPAPDSTLLAVHVPADAQVFVNGLPTRSQGQLRQYLSRGLAPGDRYTYEIRAEVTRDGRSLTSTQTANVRAGEMAQLVFQLDPQTQSALVRRAETSLKLHVPEAARVTLEGQPTRALGSPRVFATRELSDGQSWEGYRIMVELDRDGSVETQTKTVDLVGGQSHELNFDFAPQQVASLR